MSTTAIPVEVRTPARAQRLRTFARFVAMGVTTSVTYGLLFLGLSAVTSLSDVAVTVIATITSTVLSNELHRRVTFRSTGAGSVARGQSAGSGMAVVGLIINSVAVAGWNAVAPAASDVATLAVVYCVSGLVGLANFAVLRRALTATKARRSIGTALTTRLRSANTWLVTRLRSANTWLVAGLGRVPGLVEARN